MELQVSTFLELKKGLSKSGITKIKIKGSIIASESIQLKEGISLEGEAKGILLFLYSDGLSLEGNNSIKNLTIICQEEKRAIFISSALTDLGTISLEQLTVNGQIQLLTREGNDRLSVEANDITIPKANALHRSEEPSKGGAPMEIEKVDLKNNTKYNESIVASVNISQGAFTIYNFNPNPDSIIQVNAITKVNIGSENAPVFGCGFLLGAMHDNGSRNVIVEKLELGEIHTTGMIYSNAPDRITAAFFNSYGSYVKNIVNNGKLVTYGNNDIIADNWGEIDHWTATSDWISYGPSGIGLVNFGRVDSYENTANIITYGHGARGFNQYLGTIGKAIFNQIETYGDGAVGIQISQPVGEIIVKKNLITHGGSGKSLINGMVLELSADALSIKKGGEVEAIHIEGDIITKGKGTKGYINNGVVKNFDLKGKIKVEDSQ